MEGGKKLLLVLVLLALIAGGIVLTVKRSRTRSQPPREVGEKVVEMIDSESLELISLPWKEWRDSGREGGMYMNPNTQKYTMGMPAECPHCGVKNAPIPPPPSAEEIDPDEADRLRIKYDAACMNQKCTKCGKRLNDAPAMPQR